MAKTEKEVSGMRKGCWQEKSVCISFVLEKKDGAYKQVCSVGEFHLIGLMCMCT